MARSPSLNEGSGGARTRRPSCNRNRAVQAYDSNLSADVGVALACASIAVPDCTRML
jgi:hypothetical protein